MQVYPGSHNGRIITWNEPISKKAVFEWDEDRKYQPHYHVMNIEWGGKHKEKNHYLPGSLVPEPWNSAYFPK